MKSTLALLFSLTISHCIANMASPYEKGSTNIAPYSSRDIGITKEMLEIRINNDYTTAHFIVNYYINTSITGSQVPLLFDAENYKEGFTVMVDGKHVSLLTIGLNDFSTDSFKYFYPVFDSLALDKDKNEAGVNWDKDINVKYKLFNLKYFKVDLAKGNHIIHVEYTANAWADKGGSWVKKYHYPYSLQPAKYWKSFGGLQVTVTLPHNDTAITTNLGKPVSSDGIVTTWQFTKIPVDVLTIYYTPQAGAYARALLKLQPIGITLLVSLLVVILHILAIRAYRRAEPMVKYSIVVIAGSIAIPFLMLMLYVYSFDIIDNAIGIHASRYHGYTFLVFILYPLLMPCYWCIMWLFDVHFKSNAITKINYDNSMRVV